jgi:hypothetical protein
MALTRQMLKHGRAGVPMEVMGLMLGEFVDDYTVSSAYLPYEWAPLRRKLVQLKWVEDGTLIWARYHALTSLRCRSPVRR